jgi:hypothetical protein
VTLNLQPRDLVQESQRKTTGCLALGTMMKSILLALFVASVSAFAPASTVVGSAETTNLDPSQQRVSSLITDPTLASGNAFFAILSVDSPNDRDQ